MMPRKILCEKVLIIKVVCICNRVCLSCMCLSKDEKKKKKKNALFVGFKICSVSSEINRGNERFKQ